MCNNVKTKCTKDAMSEILKLESFTDLEPKIWKLVKPKITFKEKLKKFSQKTDLLRVKFNEINQNMLVYCWNIINVVVPLFIEQNKGKYTEELCTNKVQTLEAMIKLTWYEDNAYQNLVEFESWDFEPGSFDKITEGAWKVMKKSVVDATQEEINKINELYKK